MSRVIEQRKGGSVGFATVVALASVLLVACGSTPTRTGVENGQAGSTLPTASGSTKTSTTIGLSTTTIATVTSTTVAETFAIATEYPPMLVTQPAFGAYRVSAGHDREHVAKVRGLSRVFRLPSGLLVGQSVPQEGSDALLGRQATITIGSLRGDGIDVPIPELKNSLLIGVGSYENHDVVFASPFTSTIDHPLFVMYDVVTKAFRKYSQGSIESGVDFAAIKGDTIVARVWSEGGSSTSYFAIADGGEASGFATFEWSDAGNAPERKGFALSPDGSAVAFLEAAHSDTGASPKNGISLPPTLSRESIGYVCVSEPLSRRGCRSMGDGP